MSRERARRIEELFERALELEGEDLRRFLESECGADAELRREVEELRDNDRSVSPVDDPLLGPRAAPAAFEAGQAVGPYQVVRLLGEGGFGRVYEAVQHTPLERRVALKVLHAGLDTESTLTRFATERQVLALLDHPGIAQVFDAGVDEGRPYFAMELVPGPPATIFSREHDLDLEGRLRLFIEICKAVQHAHHKGIIHRDLKPSNVLVTEVDGRPMPKVIDFGIAKALQGPLTSDATLTLEGQLIGTPAYMSPEQASGRPEDVDTRSDVYSLGTILYELLTEQPTIDRSELESGSIEVVVRKIKEQTPAKPSTRVGTVRPQLARRLRGDLDRIVLKALEKECNRRYDSPGALAADIGRHLANEPILARSPSAVYRVRKFASRHRSLVTAGLTLALALPTATIISTVQAVRAVRAEERAGERLTESEEVLNFFIRDVIGGVDHLYGGTADVSVKEVVDKAAASMDTRLKEHPHVRSRILQTLGHTYMSLAQFPQAMRSFEASWLLSAEVRGEDDPDTIIALADLALTQALSGETEEALERALTAVQRLESTLGPDDARTRRVRMILARVRMIRGEVPQALEIFEEQREFLLSTPDASTPALIDCSMRLGHLHTRRGNDESAGEYLQEALDLAIDFFGESHTKTRICQSTMAQLHESAGRYEEALEILEPLLEATRATHGPDHPAVLTSEAQLGSLYRKTGRAQEAEPLLVRAHRMMIRKLGAEHSETAKVAARLAEHYRSSGDLGRALPMAEENLERCLEKRGKDHPDTLLARITLATVLFELRALEDAEEQHVLAVAEIRRVLGPSHIYTASALLNYGNTLLAMEKLRPAEETYLAAQAATPQEMPDNHPLRAHIRTMLEQTQELIVLRDRGN